MGKTTEKIINYWLVYWVESKEWLQWYQNEFRREGGLVVCLEEAIRKAQVNKVSVFFDIEKAYVDRRTIN